MRVFIMSLVLLTYGISFAEQNRTDQNRTVRMAERALIALENGNYNRVERLLHRIIRHEEDQQDARLGYITNQHYLEGTDCGTGSIQTLVGSGSEVEILDPRPRHVGHYTKAIKVKLVRNSIYNAISAPVGCIGFAIEGYVTN